MSLILSRRVEESIRIGEDVYVTIKAVRGGVVSIAVDAPREVNVVRTELLERDEEVARG